MANKIGNEEISAYDYGHVDILPMTFDIDRFTADRYRSIEGRRSPSKYCQDLASRLGIWYKIRIQAQLILSLHVW